MAYSNEDLDRLRSYEKVHLRGIDNDLEPGQKIDKLHEKDRRKWYMLILNLLAVAFFTYSYIFDLTNLGDTIYLIILVVFTVNVGLIFLQKKQIRELVEYYRSV